MNHYPLSAMLTSLPLDFAPSLAPVAQLGFTHVDIVAVEARPREHLDALAESGLLVGCAALGRGLAEGHGLEVASLEARRETLGLIERQVADAATLGATTAYLVPPKTASADALQRFAEGCSLIAEIARRRMVQLCVEPVPGRALPSAAATLDWLEQNDLDRVRLLLDVGHCLISKEDAGEVVRRAGRRLGHVHLDDNDGIGDLHWALLTGQLTEAGLKRFLLALGETGYEGILAFELNPKLADPAAALEQGKQILERLVSETFPMSRSRQ